MTFLALAWTKSGDFGNNYGPSDLLTCRGIWRWTQEEEYDINKHIFFKCSCVSEQTVGLSCPFAQRCPRNWQKVNVGWTSGLKNFAKSDVKVVYQTDTEGLDYDCGISNAPEFWFLVEDQVRKDAWESVGYLQVSAGKSGSRFRFQFRRRKKNYSVMF